MADDGSRQTYRLHKFRRSNQGTCTNQKPIVEEGARVEVGQTLGILEAMKLFNELKSDHAGVVKRIAVRNADPVEYGQLLFELV
jgi:biotin carboxyl carrier protein